MSHLTIIPPAPPVANADHPLWPLSRQVAEDDRLRGIIESLDSWHVPAVLRATTPGRELLGALDAYDRHYGRRPGTWTDDPTPIVETLRELMRVPGIARVLPQAA